MTTKENNQQQGVQTVEPLSSTGNPGLTDQRQEAIEQEKDTARLRSEKKSVEDSKDQNPAT